VDSRSNADGATPLLTCIKCGEHLLLVAKVSHCASLLGGSASNDGLLGGLACRPHGRCCVVANHGMMICGRNLRVEMLPAKTPTTTTVGVSSSVGATSTARSLLPIAEVVVAP
jgi:hypothetical protein